MTRRRRVGTYVLGCGEYIDGALGIDFKAGCRVLDGSGDRPQSRLMKHQRTVRGDLAGGLEVSNIAFDKIDLGGAVVQIGQLAGGEIVEDPDSRASVQKTVDEVRTDEPSTARYENLKSLESSIGHEGSRP